MEENNLDANYWQDRYEMNETGWDIGKISQPLQFYFDQLKDKKIRILIPGCGNGHEAIYLYEKGFMNVYLLDFASFPLQQFCEKYPMFPEKQVIQANFFEQVGQYDLIVEQTLFCAIHPTLRSEYAAQASRLLKKGGKLVGVLFNREFEDGPPFGGSIPEYEICFKPYFSIVKIAECYNSIPQRREKEAFIRLVK